MAGKRESGGTRNKFMQVLLVNGHPDLLYTTRKYSVIDFEAEGNIFHLGSANTGIKKYLSEIPGGKITSIDKESKRTIGIEGFKGLRVRKAGRNTTIEVSAATEGSLHKKIDKLRDYLSENNVGITERCTWICNVDVAKEAQKNEIESDKEIVHDAKTSEIHGNTEQTRNLNKLARKLVKDHDDN